MTIKEQGLEIMDFFEAKYALTEKINHNTKVLADEKRAIAAANKMGEAAELKATGTRYRKALREQIRERGKYSFTKLADSTGIGISIINSKYISFMDSKEKGLKFKDLLTG